MSKEHFGIFSPILGKREDMPNVLLPFSFHTDNQDVVIKDNEVHFRKKRAAALTDENGDGVQTPDENPVLHYHTFVLRSTGTEYVLVFTKAHIYHWNESAGSLDLKYTCSEDCDHWQVVSYNDKVIATNNVDPVLVWDTTGDFEPLGYNGVKQGIVYAWGSGSIVDADSNSGQKTLYVADTSNFSEGDVVIIGYTGTSGDKEEYGEIDSISAGESLTLKENLTYDHLEVDEENVYPCFLLTKAKFITVFENYLVLGYTYENSNYYPQRIRWCDLGDESQWDRDDAGSVEIGKADFLSGFGHYQGHLIIFKKESMYEAWLVPSSYIFNASCISPTVGCQAPWSIVNDDKGRLYWFASDDTFRELSQGTISDPIQTQIVDNIYNASFEKIRGAYITDHNEIWWSIPYDNALNNKVIVFKEGIWLIVDMDISCFGYYHES